MKLNKILALALSGVMAVSMLAGCSNNNGGNNEEEQTPATGVVAAVNNGQSADNKVKITFTADNNLDTALQAAVNAAGEDANFDAIETKLLIALDDATAMNAGTAATVLNTNKDGSDITGVEVYTIEGKYTEDAAEKEFAKKVDSIVSTLKASETGSVGGKCVKYSYTGNVSMIKVTSMDGSVKYVGAVVINATGTSVDVTV